MWYFTGVVDSSCALVSLIIFQKFKDHFLKWMFFYALAFILRLKAATKNLHFFVDSGGP